MGQSPICSPAGHIDCTSTHFSHHTVLPAETLVFATSNKWLSISLYGVPDSNDTQMIHVPWKLFTFFLPMREGNAGLTLQNTYLECTLDTLNNWFYNNSCFPSKIVQVQWFCKISTFCYWLLVFSSTSSKCSLRQPNPDQRLAPLAWFALYPHWVVPLCKKLWLQACRTRMAAYISWRKKLCIETQKVFNKRPVPCLWHIIRIW